jgi:hypothetical protein
MIMKSIRNILWGGLIIFMIWGCERDYMFRGGTEGIAFSVDTVMFDTIFTSIGSATRHFRVYNPYGSDMTIDAIQLAGGEDSKFRINVNGIPEHSIDDVALRTGDSLFVFVEVTINPDSNSDASFVVVDSVLFYTKERIQSVKLVAYGQDVVLLRKDSIDTQTFTSEKPYLIYDWLMVGEGATLTIEEGAHLHFYQGASLIVHKEASLIVNGTLEKPVVFTGSRLEGWYADKPGQWGSIWLMPGSRNHSINYAEIRNATYGLIVDSVGINGEEPLMLSNTRIEHITKQGLVAQSSSIIAHNSLFADCGSASVALTLGGNYSFFHCTIANYYKWGYRGIPALLLSNYFLNDNDELEILDMESALFSNCIIYGSNENEIGLDFEPKPNTKSKTETQKEFLLNYKFENSLIKTTIKEEGLSNKNHYLDVIVNRNPSFMDFASYNYHLDTLSVAQNAGNVEIARRFPFDHAGNRRVDGAALPDLGFLERIEQQ